MTTRMQQRRGTATQWTTGNPVLAAGEIGFETDTNKFKIGDGSSTWSALKYFLDIEKLNVDTEGFIRDNEKGESNGVATLNANGQIPISQLGLLINAAPGALDTLGELASAVGEIENIAGSIVSTHNADTTLVHGIADTSVLATATTVATAKTEAISAAASASVTAISTAIGTEVIDRNAAIATAKTEAISAAASATTSSITAHESDTTNVHGIANTSLLATTANVADAKSEALSAAEAGVETHRLDTTNVHGIADTSVLATATTVADAITAALTTAGTAADTKVSTAVAGLTKSSVGLSNVDNTTDAGKPISTAAQTALDLKSPLASPTFTGTVVLPAVTAGGSIVPGTDNIYDLGSPTKMWKDIYVGPGSLYVNGQKVIQDESGAIVVSADVDENLGLRTSGSGNIELDPTGTGSVNIKGPLVVEAGANFSSADGNGITFSNGLKSDSLASKTLDTDLSLSGNGTGKVYLNDNAEVNGNLVVGGNLTVSGTTTTVNSETISLADNIIDLNSNFTTGTPTENAGLRVMRGDSNAVQVRWNESSDKWEFTTDGTNYSVIAPTDSPTFTGTVTIPAGASISGFAPLASPTFTGTVTVAANGVAFTDGTQTKAGVPSTTSIPTAIAAGAHTLAAGRADQFIPLTGAVVITLPAAGYSTGQSIDFYQESGTGARFESTNGVVGTPGRNFRTTNSVVTAMKTAAGWLVFGDLAV